MDNITDALHTQYRDLKNLYWEMHTALSDREYKDPFEQEADMVALGKVAEALQLVRKARRALADANPHNVLER